MEKKKAITTDKNTIKILKSGNQKLIELAIEDLRENGNSAYIPFILEILHTTDQPEIKKKILNLFSELKQRKAIPELMKALQNKEYKNEWNNILQSCWENGMDYSKFLPVFIDLAISEDFMTSLDSCTVITGMTGEISDSTYQTESRKIKEALLTEESKKKEILQDILEYLPQLKEGTDPDDYIDPNYIDPEDIDPEE